MVAYIYKLHTLIFYLRLFFLGKNKPQSCLQCTHALTDAECVAATHRYQDTKSSLCVAFDLLFLYILLVHRAG